MLRSLYSGISGLQAHQQMLDVTGNNIANVNTVGFKASAVQFEDTLSQLMTGATAPGANQGGSNPAQIGLGVKVAAISTNFTQGSAESTGKPTDLMLNGDGFFVLNNGQGSVYTRAGDFDFDSNGTLVAPNGYPVQGWTADANGNIDQNGALGNIVLPKNTVVGAKDTTTTSFTGNLPSDAAAGTMVSRDVTVYDASGNPSTMTLTFQAAGVDTTGGATDGDTVWNVYEGDQAAVTGGTATGLGALAFKNGVQDTANETPLGNTAAGIALGTDALTGYATISSLAFDQQDGHAAGTLTSYTIGSDGVVSGSYSNGVIQPIARIALATFTNPGGLQKNGDSTYSATGNSGTQVNGGAGDPGFGGLSAGYLEASNVDLSQEFTNLIVAQRGFQANARIITTSDSVLQELVNLKTQ